MLWTRGIMVKVEREDFEKSFVTTLIFTDGDEGQEIQVYAWEADAIEASLKTLPLEAVLGFYNKSGKTTIKEW
jgi:hypothetical protein